MSRFVLPDLLTSGLNIIFCGCAASSASARLKQYYAGPGNKFWNIIFQTRLTDRLLQPSEYNKLLTFGIGLTDIVKHNSGGDSNFRKEDFDQESLLNKIEQYQPKILCFNGKRAAVEFTGNKVAYGLISEKVEDTVLFVAPSTSGSACRFWDAKVWHDLAGLSNSISSSYRK